MPEVAVAEPPIRRHVRERKIKLGLTRRETFLPQSYSWGAEAQVDWYEAYAEICGERQKVYLFCIRSMASGGAFHRAFPHASQQAFLEAQGHSQNSFPIPRSSQPLHLPIPQSPLGLNGNGESFITATRAKSSGSQIGL
jgi:hypothetical protein